MRVGSVVQVDDEVDDGGIVPADDRMSHLDDASRIGDVAVGVPQHWGATISRPIRPDSAQPGPVGGAHPRPATAREEQDR